MKKKIAVILSLVMMLNITLVSSFAEAKVISEDFSLVINGEKYIVPSNEQKPYINQDKRTMVPVRFVSEQLNAKVDWNNETNTAIITKDSKTISIKIGEPQIKVNSETIKMNTKAELTKARTFIPARYIAESLGAKVEWDNASRTVSIITGEFKPTNLEDYGLTLKQEFPITVEKNGLQVTLNALNIYPYDSDEAQLLVKRYDLPKVVNGVPTYLILTNFKLKNNSNREYRYDGKDIQPKYGLNIAHNFNYVVPTNSFELRVRNNGDYLFQWVLEPGEQTSGNSLFVIQDKDFKNVGIELFPISNNHHYLPIAEEKR